MSDPEGDLWLVFWSGDRHAIAAQRCPTCGGALLWSPHVSATPRKLCGATKYPMGLSVYCLGTCNYMVAHLDGVAPEWALAISDWDAFNREVTSTPAA